jgi:Holliday junction resolvasome RuvABC endonuclease subunit
MLLPQSDAQGADAADALAVAITHAHWSQANRLTEARMVVQA